MIVIDNATLKELADRYHRTEADTLEALEHKSFREMINSDNEYTVYAPNKNRIMVLKGGRGLATSTAKARTYHRALCEAIANGTARFRSE